MNFDPQIVAKSNRIEQPARHGCLAETERRESSRLRTVYRIAHVKTAEDDGLARVQNISDEGLGLQLHIPVMLGDAVTVRLTEDTIIMGRIVWTSGADCGLQLTDPLDSEALLQNLAAQARSVGQRPLRMPINKPAIARSEQGLQRIAVQDISQNGMKVEHDGSFDEGLVVKVSLSSGLERRGVVRWSHDGIAGLILLEPFRAIDLSSLKSL
ncbi:hypothetical protein EAH79_01390 [Sphingomonas koreensis]|nr:hypothetical protein EAH79_01390 [Sphingomonas koreensis]